MKAIAVQGLVLALLIAGGVASVDALGDTFQTRGDRVPRDSQSRVVLDVEVNAYKGTVTEAAQSLLAACAGTVANRIVADPGLVELRPGRYQFEITPRLGRNNRVKLVGCLEDFTLDHLRGDVVSITART